MASGSLVQRQRETFIQSIWGRGGGQVPPALDYLVHNSCFISVAVQIPHNARPTPIPYTGCILKLHDHRTRRNTHVMRLFC